MRFALYTETPRFTKNLTCQEAPQRRWSCSTQAVGTGISYDWFINDDLVNTDDDRVHQIVQSGIVLNNLQSSDMQLTLRVRNSIRGQTYNITQTAAILVHSTPCPTSEPFQTNG